MTCEKALSLVEDVEPDVKSSKPPKVSSVEPCLVDCTMSDLKKTALEGCATCAIIYAGLKTPLSHKLSWIGHTSDEELVVMIDIDVGLRDVEIRYGEDFAGFTLLAAPYSGMSYPSATSQRAYQFTRNFMADNFNIGSLRQVLQRLHKPLLPSDRTDSPASFKQISRWMEECRSHARCGIPEPTTLPKRVIDVGTRDETVSRFPSFPLPPIKCSG
jgi:hypothetical protein